MTRISEMKPMSHLKKPMIDMTEQDFKEFKAYMMANFSMLMTMAEIIWLQRDDIKKREQDGTE